jgi:hypothetical protein
LVVTTKVTTTTYIVYFVVTVSDVTAFASGSSPANAISVEDGTEQVEFDLEKAAQS